MNCFSAALRESKSLIVKKYHLSIVGRDNKILYFGSNKRQKTTFRANLQRKKSTIYGTKN